MGRKSMALIAGPLVAAVLAGCGSSSSNKTAVVEDAYAGSQACKACHSAIYDSFAKSGHPFKLSKVENGQVPVFPFSSIAGALELVQASGAGDNALGIPASYNDATYVIGGFGWKARWIDADGYIVTGTKVQYNVADGSLGNYDPGVYGAAAGKADKSYNCGNCHTTGWRPYDADLNDNRQDDLPGMAGTWAEAGINCEACHGAGAKHAKSKSKDDIVRVATARTLAQLAADDQGYGLAVTCSECHTRDGERLVNKGYKTRFEDATGEDLAEGGRIIAKGGLAQHHEQYDELLGIDPDTNTVVGKKLASGMTCNTCHDPHKTTKHQDLTGVPGIKQDCNSCHAVGLPDAVAMPAGSAMASLACIDCHMPRLAKNAITTGFNKKFGDIRSHIFKIDLSKNAQLTADGKFMYPWITAEYSCGACHNGEDSFDLSGVDLSGYKFHQDSVGLAGETFKGEYAGSATCGSCHEAKYAEFSNSGHPYKLSKVENSQVPAFPFTDIDGALELVKASGTGDNALGIPASYNDATYVIGGFGWKARWIDADGYIVTGTKVQYNVADGSLGSYDAGKYGAANNAADKSYNCGNCHTTGWKPYDAVLNDNRQDDLVGMAGTWAEAGIQCEACHGAGLRHVFTRSKADIVAVATARTLAQLAADDQGHGLAVTCSECHTRDGERLVNKGYKTRFEDATGLTLAEGGRIIAKGGLAQHHEQYDELLGIDPDTNAVVGKKLAAGVTCIDCHDPHKTTKHQAETGVAAVVDCKTCHADKSSLITPHGFFNMDCLDCHMPELAKNAISNGTNAAGKTLGDIKTHIFKIDLSKTEQLTADGGFMYPWITADFACGSCHDNPAAKVASLNTKGGKIHQ